MPTRGGHNHTGKYDFNHAYMSSFSNFNDSNSLKIMIHEGIYSQLSKLV